MSPTRTATATAPDPRIDLAGNEANLAALAAVRRKEYERCLKNTHDFDALKRGVEARIKEIDEAIPLAQANGEFARADELRAERSANEVRRADDLATERLLAAAQDKAKAELARAEAPADLAAYAAATRDLVAAVESLRLTSAAWDAARTRAKASFGAGYGLFDKEHPLNPENVPLSSFVRRYAVVMRDYRDQPITG